jgi:16S rRNA (cytosine1402-N4)-methyltransferase
MAQPVHIPVMINEVLQGLKVQPGGRYVDCTLGAGGHAAAILELSQPGGQLLGIDADPTALGIASETLAPYDGSFVLVNDNFSHLKSVCEQRDFAPVHGVLFDLGLGSFQIDVAERGFSFQQDAPLDMRVSPMQETNASDIVNGYGEAELANLIWKYGEEPGSRRVARAIVRRRPVETTAQLAAVVAGALGGRHGKTHPATRTFQALRIAVNGELENLESALGQAINVLGSEGRLVLISYHSLEDRIVKQFLRREASGCICPPGTMSCVCGHTPTVKLITKRVIVPAQAEMRLNPRSRSARMRVAERVLNEEEHKDLVQRLVGGSAPVRRHGLKARFVSRIARAERTMAGTRREVPV